MLKKEMLELKRAVKQNLKITDMPDMEDTDDEEDFEELASTLKIVVSKDGQAEIEGEVKKFKVTEYKLLETKAFKTYKSDVQAWLKTKEVQRIASVEKAYYASKDGQLLLKDWKAFGVALKKAIKTDKETKVVTIDNEELNGDVQDELDDVYDHYDTAFKSKSKWLPMYKKAWVEALKNKEATKAFADSEKMKLTAEYKVNMKNLNELMKSVDKNVKVTDLPKKFKSSDW